MRSGAIEWLANACEVLGVRDSAEVSHAERYLSRVSPSCIGELRRTHTERAQTGARFTCSYEIKRGDHSVVWVEDRGRFFCSPEGEPIRILGTLRCLDQSCPSDLRAARSINFDDLTGQYNRGRLRESLEHVIEYALRYDSTGAYLQLGIDNLPLIHTPMAARLPSNRPSRCRASSTVHCAPAMWSAALRMTSSVSSWAVV